MVHEDDVREIRREVERIKDRIDDIGHIQALQVRADPEARKLVLAYFSGSGGRNRARIYLAADGTKGVSEIAVELGVAQGLVTMRCQEMYERGLLGWEAVGNSKVYHKTVIERALNLSRELESVAFDT